MSNLKDLIPLPLYKGIPKKQLRKICLAIISENLQKTIGIGKINHAIPLANNANEIESFDLSLGKLNNIESYEEHSTTSSYPSKKEASGSFSRQTPLIFQDAKSQQINGKKSHHNDNQEANKNKVSILKKYLQRLNTNYKANTSSYVTSGRNNRLVKSSSNKKISKTHKSINSNDLKSVPKTMQIAKDINTNEPSKSIVALVFQNTKYLERKHFQEYFSLRRSLKIHKRTDNSVTKNKNIIKQSADKCKLLVNPKGIKFYFGSKLKTAGGSSKINQNMNMYLLKKNPFRENNDKNNMNRTIILKPEIKKNQGTATSNSQSNEFDYAPKLSQTWKNISNYERDLDFEPIKKEGIFMNTSLSRVMNLDRKIQKTKRVNRNHFKNPEEKILKKKYKTLSKSKKSRKGKFKNRKTRGQYLKFSEWKKSIDKPENNTKIMNDDKCTKSNKMQEKCYELNDSVSLDQETVELINSEYKSKNQNSSAVPLKYDEAKSPEKFHRQHGKQDTQDGFQDKEKQLSHGNSYSDYKLNCLQNYELNPCQDNIKRKTDGICNSLTNNKTEVVNTKKTCKNLESNCYGKTIEKTTVASDDSKTDDNKMNKLKLISLLKKDEDILIKDKIIKQKVGNHGITDTDIKSTLSDTVVQFKKKIEDEIIGEKYRIACISKKRHCNSINKTQNKQTFRITPVVNSNSLTVSKKNVLIARVHPPLFQQDRHENIFRRRLINFVDTLKENKSEKSNSYGNRNETLIDNLFTNKKLIKQKRKSYKKDVSSKNKSNSVRTLVHNTKFMVNPYSKAGRLKTSHEKYHLCDEYFRSRTLKYQTPDAKIGKKVSNCSFREKQETVEDKLPVMSDDKLKKVSKSKTCDTLNEHYQEYLPEKINSINLISYGDKIKMEISKPGSQTVNRNHWDNSVNKGIQLSNMNCILASLPIIDNYKYTFNNEIHLSLNSDKISKYLNKKLSTYHQSKHQDPSKFNDSEEQKNNENKLIDKQALNNFSPKNKGSLRTKFSSTDQNSESASSLEQFIYLSPYIHSNRETHFHSPKNIVEIENIQLYCDRYTSEVPSWEKNCPDCLIYNFKDKFRQIHKSKDKMKPKESKISTEAIYKSDKNELMGKNTASTSNLNNLRNAIRKCLGLQTSEYSSLTFGDESRD